jgi:hypothetical protein
MNRVIALFVALVALFAHVLAIHNDGSGSFAVPYDQAYVGMRLARNMVFEGQLGWNPGHAAFESDSSVLWILFLSLGERVAPALHASMNLVAQTAGILAMLAMVVLSAQFRAERNATLITPLSLAASGAVAAAAANGLDTALFTFTAVAAFLTLERGRSAWFALSMCACVLTRPEGIVFVLGMLVLRLLGKPNPDEGGKRVSLAAFVWPIAVMAVTMLVRWRTSGFFWPPIMRAYFDIEPGQLSGGVAYLSEFARVAVMPLLLVFPAWYLVRGKLSRTGAHAVFLSLLWCSTVALRGRAPQPFFEALVPALPFICIGIQEGMIPTLDGGSRVLRKVTLFLFALGLVGSVLASKSPGDLGPLHLAQAHERWVAPAATARFGFEAPLGRLGIYEEILHTQRMRAVGLFLRDHVEPGSSVLTPWPGAVGYLSRQPVFDVLGRASPLHALDRPRTWVRREYADVIAALQMGADFVVPHAKRADAPLHLRELAHAWREGLDLRVDDPGRLASIEQALAPYELVTIPIGDKDHGEPFHLLRARALDLRPRLELRLVERTFLVLAHGRSHEQIADLRVSATDALGRTYSLRPSGELTDAAEVSARRSILVYDTGTRAIELCKFSLPARGNSERWVELRAVLLNPTFEADDPFAFVSDEVRRALAP